MVKKNSLRNQITIFPKSEIPCEGGMYDLLEGFNFNWQITLFKPI